MVRPSALGFPVAVFGLKNLASARVFVGSSGCTCPSVRVRSGTVRGSPHIVQHQTVILVGLLRVGFLAGRLFAIVWPFLPSNMRRVHDVSVQPTGYISPPSPLGIF